MWQIIIPEICKAIERIGVSYHIDASSSLYVCGLEFEMDDLDVTVEWGRIERVRQAFLGFEPEVISGTDPQMFTFDCRGFPIDIMSYPSESGIGPETERTQVNYYGHTIWTKVPAFYLKHMRQDHPLRESAFTFFCHNDD